MKAQKECFDCLANQAKAHQVPIQKYLHWLDSLPKDLYGASIDSPPPKIAIELYSQIAKDLGVEDPYLSIKTQSIQKAYQVLQNIDIQSLTLREAIKICALGNVIDYGSASQFCIHGFDFCKEQKQLEFARFEIERFVQKLQKATSLVVLGDNAGENIFDTLLLKVVKRDFANLRLYYFVRGAPIINDITLQDLHTHKECEEIFQIAQVVDSGVKSAGFIFEDASAEAQKIFNDASVILSKGMGNFECLEEREDPRVFYLLKIKCHVVAKKLRFSLGKIFFG